MRYCTNFAYISFARELRLSSLCQENVDQIWTHWKNWEIKTYHFCFSCRLGIVQNQFKALGLFSLEWDIKSPIGCYLKINIFLFFSVECIFASMCAFMCISPCIWKWGQRSTLGIYLTSLLQPLLPYFIASIQALSLRSCSSLVWLGSWDLPVSILNVWVARVRSQV